MLPVKYNWSMGTNSFNLSHNLSTMGFNGKRPGLPKLIHMTVTLQQLNLPLQTVEQQSKISM